MHVPRYVLVCARTRPAPKASTALNLFMYLLALHLVEPRFTTTLTWHDRMEGMDRLNAQHITLSSCTFLPLLKLTSFLWQKNPPPKK